jgi:hypothetical protein
MYHICHTQNPRIAHDFCCSIGMRRAEFGNDVDELASVAKQGCEMRTFLMRGQWKCIHTPFSDTSVIGFIGDVYVNGQFQDVWCDSNVAITNMSMYFKETKSSTCDSVSCYYLNTPLINPKLASNTKGCLADSQIAISTYFLCAWPKCSFACFHVFFLIKYLHFDSCCYF